VLSKNFVYAPSGQCPDNFKNCTAHLCVPQDEICPITLAVRVDENYNLTALNVSAALEALTLQMRTKQLPFGHYQQ